MVKVDIEQIRQIMSNSTQIRNMSVCAHVDAGKSTLSDSLVSAAGLLAERRAGEACTMDTRKDEQERGITIKSTAVSLYYEKSDVPHGESSSYVINLIDSPGHVDFSSEVTAALRVTDGTLILVDCIDGICVQTETVLRQALTERIKPVLHINKLDRMIIELKMDSESIYKRLYNLVNEVNALISTYYDEGVGDIQVYPEKGSVSFGSGYHCWAFTLNRIAKIFNKKSGANEQALVKRLWGENFWDPETKRWHSTSVVDGRQLKRGFCYFILDPIIEIYSSIHHNEPEKALSVTEKFGMTIKFDPTDKTSLKETTRHIMQRFLPVGESVLSMIVQHLPSPQEAQRYRMPLLYTGGQEDEYAKSIEKCDPEGPLVIYISKMIPTRDNTRFFAFGRVFSGTVSMGQRVRILESNYQPGQKVSCCTVSRTHIMMAGNQEPVHSVPCGNIVTLSGVDKFINKTATITSESETECYPLKDMKYTVSPVVRVAVEPRNGSDLPKLIEGMNKLKKSCQLVQCIIDEETREYIIAAAGELHLEICVKDLEDFMKGGGLKISEPVVSLRETVSDSSDQTCLAKSSNKHNRIWAKMQPLGEELCQAIENGEISSNMDSKERARILIDQYGWTKEDANKIWCFGPDNTGPNIIVDCTKGVQSVQEVKSSIIAAWQEFTSRGVICGEQVRGLRLNIEDLSFHSDSVHRGGNQIIPMSKRCFKACQLTAKPKIMEPIFVIEVTTPETEMGKVYSFIHRKRATVISEEQKVGTPVYIIKAYLPVHESFGFDGDLRGLTSGRAFTAMSFDHWDTYPGDPLEKGTKTFDLVEETRKRKRLRPGNPELNEYLDKL